MSDILMFVILLMIAGLAVVAKWVRLPYPVVFLFGGIALALIPGVPQMRLQPELVFLVFLPPLIFGDGYVTDFRQFKRYIQPITLLATALVVATSVSVAFVAHWLMGLPLEIGFVLGAILSPTDTIATDAIAETTGMPRRLLTILGGESLVNDATGLVIYKFAVAAIVVGSFSLGSALLQFLYVAVAGIGIGVIGGELLTRLTRFLSAHDLADDAIVVLITLITPFLLYLPADRIGASGVLAAAAGGIYVSRRGGGMYTADARILAAGVWNMLFFLFNGAIFILLGLQLRSTLSALSMFPVQMLVQYGLGISAAVIVIRLVWVFIVAELRWDLDNSIASREGPRPPRSWTFVLGWAGMRGIVSLAAALAIPETVTGGAPFPARDLILFITFSVICVTLVGQGLSLSWIIRRFNVVDEEDNSGAIALARVRTAEAGLERLQSLEHTFESATHWEVAGKLRATYEDQLGHYQGHLDGTMTADVDSNQHALNRDLSHETLNAERAALAEMRRVGEITDDVYRHIQYDIDLHESRLR